jgi:hypothetical protein
VNNGAKTIADDINDFLHDVPKDKTKMEPENKQVTYLLHLQIYSI